MSSIDWNLVRAFAATAEAGSLSAAARKLRLAQPTLSRQVAMLEADLGVALFERVGRKLILTTTGAGLLNHARVMADAADAMAVTAAGQSQDITGRVSISATDAVSTYLLPGIVARIRREAPQVTIVVVATDSISNLQRREADIAIRHLRPTEPELIGRHIDDMAAHFYAADTWVAQYGLPQTIPDLAQVDMLGFEPVERFIEHLAAAGVCLTADRCRIVSGNAVAVWEMLRHGLGVGMMFGSVAARTPGLTRLLPDWPGIAVPVWLVTHRELHTSRRVRVVFDIIADEWRGLSAASAAAVSARPRTPRRAARSRRRGSAAASRS